MNLFMVLITAKFFGFLFLLSYQLIFIIIVQF